MKAAIYARKSSAQDVHEDAKSVTRQVAGARAWCAARGWDVVNVYTDDAVSGFLFTGRPAFQAMLRAAEAGAFQAIVLFDLDRFGRNSRKTMEALHSLADAGVQVWDYATGQAVDIDSFEGETLTFLRARFAQEEREKARKRITAALLDKARKGWVTGGSPYGYTNVRVDDHTERVVCEPEARVIRDVYARFAAGESIYGIARRLNASKARPRARKRGEVKAAADWTTTTVRQLLRRDSYRGLAVYRKTRTRYGRELGKAKKAVHGGEREAAQIRTPESEWISVEVPSLRIVDERTWQRVAERLVDFKARDVGGRASKNPRNAPLLSGGMLLCPECGGHFETRDGRYECARRRRAGTCTNTLRLDIKATDAAVLEQVAGDALSPAQVEALMAEHVDGAEGGDERAALEASLAKLRAELRRLVESVAAGVPAASVAGAIKERELEVVRLEARLKAPVPQAADARRIRAALHQTTKDWREVLRGQPLLAKALLRRLVGPLTLWKDEKYPDWLQAEVVRWQAVNKAGGELLAQAGVQPGQSRKGRRRRSSSWPRPRAAR